MSEKEIWEICHYQTLIPLSIDAIIASVGIS